MSSVVSWAERERLQDPLSKVEHLGKDRKKAGGRKAELTQIKESVDARHSDPYLLNRRLRAELRVRLGVDAGIVGAHIVDAGGLGGSH